MASKEILENVLNHYTGTILYVSHDRYFINKTADRILDLTNGKVLNYLGNYDYYLEKKEAVEAAYLGKSQGESIASSSRITTFPAGQTRRENTSSQTKESEGKLNWLQQKEEQARIRKRKNELKKTEDEIQRLEQRSNEIDELMALEEVYTNPQRLIELNNEKREIDGRLLELMELWEKLAGEE